MKHKRNGSYGDSSLKLIGKLTDDSKQKADAMNRQLESVFTHETAFDEQPAQYNCPPIQMPHINITTSAGVLKLLQNLNPGKAPGPDGITPKVLRAI